MPGVGAEELAELGLKDRWNQVANTMQNPNAIEYPKAMPRYRTDKPNVRFPSPHRQPNSRHSRHARGVLSANTSRRSDVVIQATIHGVASHAANPITSQKLSHAQPWTRFSGA